MSPTPPHDDPQRQFWDTTASRYDRIVGLLGTRYDEVAARLRRDLRGRRRALEIAAGTGQFTPAIASAVDRLVATDYSEAMLERLRARVADLDTVEVRSADVYDLSAFDDGAFDAVVCANVLHVLERPRLALAELRRVLAPEGLLVVPTFCHGQTRAARLTSRVMGLVSRFQAHHRYDQDALVAEVTAAGFTVEAAEDLGGLLPLIYLRARVGDARVERR